MKAAFIALPSFALDQILAPSAVNILFADGDYLRDLLFRQHRETDGEHDDPLVARAKAVIWFEGVFGAGGAWQVEEGVNVTVAALGPAQGRGRITFSGTWATGMFDALYSPILHPLQRSASAPGVVAQEARWYNRTTTTFDFSCMQDDGAGAYTENSNGGIAFSLEVYGLRAAS